MTKVRPATPADAPWVDALARAEGLSVELTAELERPQARAWVIDPEIGFLTAWLVADELQIQDLSVRASERRRGHGRRLLSAAELSARAEGATSITLELRESNHGALALYLAAGFEQVGSRPRYYDNGETALLLTRVLKGAPVP